MHFKLKLPALPSDLDGFVNHGHWGARTDQRVEACDVFGIHADAAVALIDLRTRHSAYFRALHISYPNIVDIRRAAAAHVNPGGGIFIHGMPASYGPFDPVRFFVDWTDGCIAVGNIAIEEIWTALDDGTVVEIQP